MNVEMHVVSAAFNDALCQFSQLQDFSLQSSNYVINTMLTSLRRPQLHFNILVQDVAHDEKETVLLLIIAQTQLGLNTFVRFKYNLLSKYTHLLA